MAQQFYLATLPYHTHHIIGAFLSYSILFGIVSPLSSAYLSPKLYRSFSQRTQINWNTRIVSLVQSILICSCSLHVIFAESQRCQMSAGDRLWAYSPPAAGRVQAFAAGYFVWDLCVTASVFGISGSWVLVPWHMQFVHCLSRCWDS